MKITYIDNKDLKYKDLKYGDVFKTVYSGKTGNSIYMKIRNTSLCLYSNNDNDIWFTFGMSYDAHVIKIGTLVVE